MQLTHLGRSLAEAEGLGDVRRGWSWGEERGSPFLAALSWQGCAPVGTCACACMHTHGPHTDRACTCMHLAWTAH